MPVTSSPEETKELASDLAKDLYKPTCMGLYGKLGAGKTTFIKGIARGLKVEKVVRSPTFNLMRIYSGRTTLYHIDLYRINSKSEVMYLEEYFLRDGITVIEWAGKVKELLPQSRIDVFFKIIGKDKREINIYDNRD